MPDFKLNTTIYILPAIKHVVDYFWANTTRPCRISTYFGAYLIHIHQAIVNNMSYSEQYEIKSL